jgi:hypothetical protein
LLADLGLGRAGARQRRINVQRVGLDAVIDATWIVVENIRGDDFKVVEGRVGKSPSSVAVLEGPDARHVGAELVIDNDASTLVQQHTRSLQAQVVRVGPASCGEQQMASAHQRRTARAVEARADRVVLVLDGSAFRIEPHMNALLFQNVENGCRDVFVFALDQPRTHLDDCHLAAEAAIHLNSRPI